MCPIGIESSSIMYIDKARSISNHKETFIRIHRESLLISTLVRLHQLKIHAQLSNIGVLWCGENTTTFELDQSPRIVDLDRLLNLLVFPKCNGSISGACHEFWVITKSLIPSFWFVLTFYSPMTLKSGQLRALSLCWRPKKKWILLIAMITFTVSKITDSAASIGLSQELPPMTIISLWL